MTSGKMSEGYEAGLRFLMSYLELRTWSYSWCA